MGGKYYCFVPCCCKLVKEVTEKALMQSVEDATPRDVSLNVIQKIFTQHPTLERDILAKASV